MRKSLARVERSLDRNGATRERDNLHLQLAEAATDSERLLALTAELRELDARAARWKRNG